MNVRNSLYLLVFLLALPATAFAQTDQLEAAPAVDQSTRSVGSYRDKSNEWMIPPGNTGALSVQMDMITTSENVEIITGTPGALKLTDAVMMRLAARYSLGGIAEVFGSASLLPKQPSGMDELAIQNGSVGTRIGLTEWLATGLKVAGGSTTNQDGAWGSAGLGLDARADIDDFVVFDMGLYGLGTGLTHNDVGVGLFEVGTTFQIVLKAPKAAAMWVGAGLFFPVADAAGDGAQINPENRVNLEIGGVLTFVDEWDIYAKYSYIDRGDISDPTTILPILDGGFDQQQLVVGLTWRFGEPDDQMASR